MVLSTVYFLVLLTQYFLPVSLETIGTDLTPPSIQTVSSSSSALPRRLRIPTLDIDTSIEAVGVNKIGNMKVPSTYHTVAWYDKGSIPGNLGAAVIVGHLDNGLGLSAVFSRLKELQPGDLIQVEDQNGMQHVFVVDQTKTYPYDSAPLNTIFLGDATKSELHLITCSGTWVSGEHNYTNRLVVYATLKK